MDCSRKCQIFEVAARVYSTSGRAGIDSWVRGFRGSGEEEQYVRRIYSSLLEHSRDSGRVLSFYDSRMESVLGEEGKLRTLS